MPTAPTKLFSVTIGPTTTFLTEEEARQVATSPLLNRNDILIIIKPAEEVVTKLPNIGPCACYAVCPLPKGKPWKVDKYTLANKTIIIQSITSL